MAKFVYTNPHLTANSVDLSAYVVSLKSNLKLDEVDATSGNSAGVKQRLAGLKDAEFEVEFMQDFAASTVDPTLYTIWSGGAAVTVAVKPINTTTSATNPQYSASCFLFDYAPIDGKVGDGAKTTVTFKATGAVTKATS